MTGPKTKEMVKLLTALKIKQRAMLVADGADEAVLRSARNIQKLKMLPAALLNALDVSKYRKIVMTVDAIRKAEELWGGPETKQENKPAEAAAEA